MLNRLRLAAFTTAASVSIASFVAISAPVASAEEFVLASGSRVRGEFLNASQSPRSTYEVKLAIGGTITLPKDQVQEVLRLSPAELEYEALRHKYPDTPAGQWDLAEWCKEKKLTEQRNLHLARVIELEPNHLSARSALGYIRNQGQWRTRAEQQIAQGKVQYKGQWCYPQEIEINEAKQKHELAERGWFGNLKRMRNNLDNSNTAKAASDAIINVSDPAALPAIKQFMEKEEDEKVRELYLRALAKIGTVPAEIMLAEAGLKDPSEENRRTALELLGKSPRRHFIDHFIQQLGSADNIMVNRAAIGLSYFKDPRSIAPLIDALETKHKYQVVSGNPGGGLSAGQGNGGAGLSTGSSTQIFTSMKQNQGVLSALVSIVGNKANYLFDVQAWKHWYNGQKKARQIDVRRS